MVEKYNTFIKERYTKNVYSVNRMTGEYIHIYLKVVWAWNATVGKSDCNKYLSWINYLKNKLFFWWKAKK